MTTDEVREKYIEFFKKEPRNHIEISPAPLIPENDTSTLFTPFGMQQLIPYLMGKSHPEGERLVNSQPSIRVDDIDEVGDNRHTTFFEMLGNWSLGDYFKKDQLRWFFEFLTNETDGLGIDPEKLYVTVFDGDEKFRVKKAEGAIIPLAPDVKSANIWGLIFQEAAVEVTTSNTPGIKTGRISYYGADKNWWSRSGPPNQMPIGEIGGPDSEVFYDFGEEYCFHENSEWKDYPCRPNCDCGRFLEVGNSVFMQYKKIDENTFEELPNKNVDFGGGLERLVAATNNEPDIFKIDVFENVVVLIKKLYFSGITDSSRQTRQDYYPTSPKLHENPDEQDKDKKYTKKDVRIIADHLRASVFLIKAGVFPSNKERGYVLRKLLRRSAVKTELLKEGLLKSGEATAPDFSKVCEEIIKNYDGIYFNLKEDKDNINNVIKEEMNQFGKTLHAGLKVLKKEKKVDGKIAFDLYQTDGFPFEITKELLEKKGETVSRSEFDKELLKHQQLSRTASAGMFKGGLADHSVETTQLHTATHLLHESLRRVLGDHVQQKGSNITKERLRFDFAHPEKLTDEEIKKVEDLVNQQIDANLPVTFKTMTLKQAKEEGALAFFEGKYDEKVKVYSIGGFSKEVCGGPHVKSTGKLSGHVRINKQESTSAGVRRLYAVIENN